MTPTPNQRETAQEVERRISDLLALYLEKYKTADDAQKAAQTRAIVVHEIAAALAAGRAKALEEAAKLVENVADLDYESPLADEAQDEFNANPNRSMNARLVSWNAAIAKGIRALIPAPPTEKDG